ncbi:MAG: mechanosensitive ion channel family protein [Tissierellia bacterium]|nr:mechanosensitive ion channel family protein [Tissierellia bacterium]
MENQTSGLNDILNKGSHFFTNTNGDLNIFGKLLTIALIYLGFKLVFKLIVKIVDNGVEKKFELHGGNDMRLLTTTELLKKVIKVLLYFIGITTGLSVFGISIAPILATAGIGSVAIGFGAQSLVKDVITGFFILLENHFSVGELVKIDSYEGIVEELGIRSTKIRDFNGDLYIIPNHEIVVVTNKSRGEKGANVSLRIPYDAYSESLLNSMQNRLDSAKKSIEGILDGPRVLGVSDFNDYSYTITVYTRVENGKTWEVQRSIRKELLGVLKDNNISINVPITVSKEGIDDIKL